MLPAQYRLSSKSRDWFVSLIASEREQAVCRTLPRKDLELVVEFLTPKYCDLDMDPKIALGLVEKFDRPFDKTSIDLNLSADEIIKIPRELAKLDTENVNGHYKR